MREISEMYIIHRDNDLCCYQQIHKRTSANGINIQRGFHVWIFNPSLLRVVERRGAFLKRDTTFGRGAPFYFLARGFCITRVIRKRFDADNRHDITDRRRPKRWIRNSFRRTDTRVKRRRIDDAFHFRSIMIYVVICYSFFFSVASLEIVVFNLEKRVWKDIAKGW